MEEDRYKFTAQYDAKQRAIRAVRFNGDGNYCLTCGSDKSLKLWSPQRSLLLQTYWAHGYEVLDAQASCDNSQLASGGADKMVALWDVASATTVRKYRTHAGRVNCVRFNEESSIIFSGSLDCTVKAWDCRSRSVEPVQTLDDAKDSVMSVTVSDHEIVTSSLDSHIRRYDLRLGKLFTDCMGHSVCSVSQSADGQCVLASSIDSTIRLIDKDTGQMLNQYKGHKNVDYKIDNCFNHKDTVVFSGSEDGNIYSWDLLEAKTLDLIMDRPLSNSKVIHSISHHPKEPFLVAAVQNMVLMWRGGREEEEQE